MQLLAEALTLERGGRPILADFSLRVPEGELVVLRGPNGAGKTTLLRALAGLLRPSHGSIQLEGADSDVEIASLCHLVGHRDGVKSGFTALENVRFWSEILSIGREGQPAEAVLERVGLARLSHAPAGWLSAGQRRRLGLARLLAARRPIWLLDEPSVSLDADGVEMLAGLIGEHLATGGVAVAATHVPLGVGAAREVWLGARAAGHDAAGGQA